MGFTETCSLPQVAPSGIDSGPHTLQHFHKPSESRTESTITKFANSIKLDGKEGTSERRDILKMEGWKDGRMGKSSQKFNKDKCKDLHL